MCHNACAVLASGAYLTAVAALDHTLGGLELGVNGGETIACLTLSRLFSCLFLKKLLRVHDEIKALRMRNRIVKNLNVKSEKNLPWH